MSFLLTAACLLFGCKVDEPLLADYGPRDQELLYMPQAAKNPFVNELLMKDAEQEITFGAAFGGLAYPKEDIVVNFKVNEEYVAVYNEQNNTDLPLLPKESYQLSGMTATILKGQTSSNALKVKIKTNGNIDPFKQYILPITLENSSSEIKINEKLKTTYLVVSATPDLKDFTDFDRAAWKVFNFSSEEASGEGPNNGRAIFAIDNDPGTYWHSVWSTGETSPPHFVSFDMGEEKILHGIYIVHRNGNPQARKIVVEGSLDGVNWDVRGTISNIPTNSSDAVKHRFFVSTFAAARYLKIIVTENQRASTNIAEIGAF